MTCKQDRNSTQLPKSLAFSISLVVTMIKGYWPKVPTHQKGEPKFSKLQNKNYSLLSWPTSWTCLVVIVWLRCLSNFSRPSFSYLPFAGGFPTLLCVESSYSTIKKLILVSISVIKIKTRTKPNLIPNNP
jgi:hypothetical protein